MKVKIGISARHIHLNKEDLEILFGKNYELTKMKDLLQKGEYACNETLTIKGEKGSINNVRILGPIRDYTQVEISKTDSYLLGLNPPVRSSGDILNSAPITLISPTNKLLKPYGCIIANRHLHMTKEDAVNYGFADNQIVKVKLNGEKGGIIDNVYIKTKDSYVFNLHLDLDDANAHLQKTDDEGEIINE
ncbi:MAG: phosphate propanoyltransferase [Bacilli bacterium]|nr:phosphate propanoyltransferase [Bacilli bacterium]